MLTKHRTSTSCIIIINNIINIFSLCHVYRHTHFFYLSKFFHHHHHINSFQFSFQVQKSTSIADCVHWSVGWSVCLLVTHLFVDPHVVPSWLTLPSSFYYFFRPACYATLHPALCVGWLVGRLVRQSVGWLVGRQVGRLVARSVGCSVGRSVGWSVSWSVCRLVG